MRPLPTEFTDVEEAPRPKPVAVVECDALDKTESCDGLCESRVGRRGGKEGRDSSCVVVPVGAVDPGLTGGEGGGGRSDRRVGRGGGGFLGLTSSLGDGIGGTADLCVLREAGSFPIELLSATEPVTV